MALPDHFEGEDVIITFEKEYVAGDGDSTTRTVGIQNVGGKVLSWNISGGGQPSEDVFAFGGKSFNFQKPREKFTASFEVIINNADFDFVQFGGQSGTRIGASEGKVMKSTDTTRRWRVMMWFQDVSSHITNATKTVTVPSKIVSCYRMVFVDVKSVTFDKSFSADDYFKGTLNLEFSSADDKGYANFIQQEGYGTGVGTTSVVSSPGLALLTTTATGATTIGSPVGLLLEARGYMDWATSATTPEWYTGSTTTDVSKRYRYTG